MNFKLDDEVDDDYEGQDCDHDDDDINDDRDFVLVQIVILQLNEASKKIKRTHSNIKN